MPKTAQRHFLVSIAGLPGYYQRWGGGSTGADTSKSYDGGSEVADVMGGPASPDDVTISRDYDPARDEPILRALRPVVSRWRTTLTKQPTDADFVPIGPPTVYPNALLTKINEPEADSASNAFANYGLVFTVGGAT